jgi:hypothetical protein
MKFRAAEESKTRVKLALQNSGKCTPGRGDDFTMGKY